MRFFALFFLLATTLFADVVPVAVVGSGPAGLSAALATSRERIETHIYLGSVPGGPLNEKTCLSNWPGSKPGKGHVVVDRLFEQLRKYHTNIHEESIVSVDFSRWPFVLHTDQGEEILAKTVILATGAAPCRLGVPGEDRFEIDTYLYKEDAKRYKNKDVAVIGGGLDAMKKARYLAKHANEVYLIVRKDHMQRPYMEQLAYEKGVNILFEHEVLSIEGKGERVTHLKLLSNRGARRLDVDGVVLAIGITPNSSLVEDQLLLDEGGYIALMGRTQMTSMPGVFAAGNVCDAHYRQGITSAADGLKAGLDAVDYLHTITSR